MLGFFVFIQFKIVSHFPFDLFFFFVFKILFIYLREGVRAGEEGGSEGEADSLMSREPDAGLDPGTPGS